MAQFTTSNFYDHLMHTFAESIVTQYNSDQGILTICPSDRQVINKREVYVLINKDHNQWIFVQIQLKEQVVELWYSLGVNSDDKHFMHALLQFIYDRSIKANSTSNPGWATWKQLWKCINKSTTSPRQLNGNDYGVFVL